MTEKVEDNNLKETVPSALGLLLIGRPGTIADRGTCVVTTMENQKTPPLPKGFLYHPQALLTPYTLRANNGVRSPKPYRIPKIF